jgi:TonB family protein
MNRYLIPLAALALAAGACSSNTASSFRTAKPVAAVPAGTLQTPWGELPTYLPVQEKAPKFAFKHMGGIREARETDVPLNGTAVLDVLVDRDGSIRDVKVQTSSGIAALDHKAVNSFVGAHSLLQVAEKNPAPYVVRFAYTIKTVALATGQDSSFQNENNHYSDMRPMGQGNPQPADWKR